MSAVIVFLLYTGIALAAGFALLSLVLALAVWCGLIAGGRE